MERILKNTRLINKPLIIRKKISDKIDTIIKNYKNIRIKAKGFNWDINASTYKIYNLNSPYSTIVKDFILKKYL